MSTYKAIKNYFNNTLKLNKSELLEIVEKTIEKSFLKIISDEASFRVLVIKTIQDVCDKKVREANMRWMDFDSYFKREVRSAIDNEVRKRINFNEINLTVDNISWKDTQEHYEQTISNLHNEVRLLKSQLANPLIKSEDVSLTEPIIVQTKEQFLKNNKIYPNEF